MDWIAIIGLFILSQEHRFDTSLSNSVSPSFCNALKPQHGQHWTVETWEQAKGGWDFSVMPLSRTLSSRRPAHSLELSIEYFRNVQCPLKF